MVDLHTHSTASDGSYSPSDLMKKAHGLGIGTIALTDHDCLDGLDEAGAAAAKLGMRFVRGVEIEIAFGPGEFHLLGLDLQGSNQKLLDAIKELAASREKRNRHVFDLFHEQGYELNYDELKERCGSRMIGRPHIAELLVEKKIVKNKQLAFDKFLAKGKPFFIQKDCLELERAIELIHSAGGLAVIAHPMSLFVSWTRMRLLFPEWQKLGIDGLEAWHPIARVVDCQRLETLAGELGLKVTAGSDYHGPIRPDRDLGKTAGGRSIEDKYFLSLGR